CKRQKHQIVPQPPGLNRPAPVPRNIDALGEEIDQSVHGDHVKESLQPAQKRRSGSGAVNNAVDQDLVDLAAKSGKLQARTDKYPPVEVIEIPLVSQETMGPAKPPGRMRGAQAGPDEIGKAGRSVIEQSQADADKHDQKRSG